MPRIAENTDSLLADLRTRMERLIDVAKKEGRDEALADLRHLVAGGSAPRAASRERKAPEKAEKAEKAEKTDKAEKKASDKKLTAAGRKNPWAGLSPEARLARVNAIRKGRGLPLKTS